MKIHHRWARAHIETTYQNKLRHDRAYCCRYANGYCTDFLQKRSTCKTHGNGNTGDRTFLQTEPYYCTVPRYYHAPDDDDDDACMHALPLRMMLLYCTVCCCSAAHTHTKHNRNALRETDTIARHSTRSLLIIIMPVRNRADSGPPAGTDHLLSTSYGRRLTNCTST
jgi:hypothetical protein